MKRVQLIRGTSTELDVMTPAEGEILVDTDRNEIRIGDGATVGGFRVPNLDLIIALLGEYTSKTGGTEKDAGLVSDLNSISISGWYKAENPLNMPSSAWASRRMFVLHMESDADDKAVQIAFLEGYDSTETATSGVVTPAHSSALRWRSAANVWNPWTQGNPWHDGLHPGQIVNPSSINVNNLLTGANSHAYGFGAYYHSNSALNVPPGGGATGWILLNIPLYSASHGMGAQIAIDLTNGTLWFRKCVVTIYTNWVRLMQTPALDAVDSYLFALNSGVTTAPGSTVAGSSLQPAAHDSSVSGGARTGTYRAMGNGVTAKSTLWNKTA